MGGSTAGKRTRVPRMPRTSFRIGYETKDDNPLGIWTSLVKAGIINYPYSQQEFKKSRSSLLYTYWWCVRKPKYVSSHWLMAWFNCEISLWKIVDLKSNSSVIFLNLTQLTFVKKTRVICIQGLPSTTHKASFYISKFYRLRNLIIVVIALLCKELSKTEVKK